MLQKLLIQNYAIIDELEIEFSLLLNGITGETGAGKSIIVGALGLILGERADSTVLQDKERKCVVEGIFKGEKKNAVRQFLRENDLDIDEELVIRREISANGKSRAFINDTPVNLSQLKELSSLLVDLHQQFDTLELGESVFQRQVLDGLANHGETVAAYRQLYFSWQQKTREYEQLKEQKLQFDKEYDYNLFQFNELEEAGLKPGELEEIEQELKLQENAEGIKSALAKIDFELQESENPVVQQLKILANQLHAYITSHPGLSVLEQRLLSAQIELQDIAREVETIGSQISYDPEKAEELNERLSSGYKLLKKHGVQTTDELLAIQQDLEAKLQAVLNSEAAIQQKEKEAGALRKEAVESARRITAGRLKQIRPFEDKVNHLLARVGMPNAKLKVDMIPAELNEWGADSVHFLFDANKSGRFLPIGKVASGGELSRLMLCIKSLVAASIDLPTLIFDEIDSGISGEAARQVGIIMKELAADRQLITITHQPQIASRADAHYFVFKEIVKDRVKTSIRRLSTEERITAIAKMLSGEKPTAAAMENAREMVLN